MLRIPDKDESGKLMMEFDGTDDREQLPLCTRRKEDAITERKKEAILPNSLLRQICAGGSFYRWTSSEFRLTYR